MEQMHFDCNINFVNVTLHISYFHHIIKYLNKLCLNSFMETFSAEARRVCLNAQRLPNLVYKIFFIKFLKDFTLLKSILRN